MISAYYREKRDNLLSLFSLFRARQDCEVHREMEKHASTQETVRGQNVFEWYEALISAALVLVLVFSLFFRIIQVDGESMVPTLQNGDKLIVWGAGYEPQRGDVVIVDSYTAFG